MTLVPSATTEPFARLPNELLCEIFHYSVVPPAYLYQRPEYIPWMSFALTLTHVCRRWRAIAIKQRSLWSIPNFCTPELARLMLSRSGQYPLHIRFQHVADSKPLPNDYIHDCLEALSEALMYPSCLETIRLDIPSYLFEEFAAKHVQAAPMLRWLHLSSDGCDLPFDFLGGSAPLLTDLTLYGCGPAYNSHLLRNLTSLKLLGGAETTFEDRLCEALRLMPALESLDLQEVYCNPPEDDTVVASLPRLRELKLKCSTVNCITQKGRWK